MFIITQTVAHKIFAQYDSKAFYIKHTCLFERDVSLKRYFLYIFESIYAKTYIFKKGFEYHEFVAIRLKAK